MGIEKIVTSLYHNLFNIKFAVVSASFNVPIAAAVNYPHGPLEMLMAGTAQAVSSFISTGITARIVQHFSPINNWFTSYFFGSLIPASVTFLLSYTSHYFNRTPELLESCIAPTLISYGTSWGTNYVTRRGYLLPKNYPTVMNEDQK